MKWTDQEKEQLAELVKLNIVNGRIMWIKIGQAMGRTANQCKTMYTIQLGLKDFRVIKKWTHADVATLFQAVEQHGREWNFIQNSYFQDRTASQIRQKFVQEQKLLGIYEEVRFAERMEKQQAERLSELKKSIKQQKELKASASPELYNTVSYVKVEQSQTQLLDVQSLVRELEKMLE